MQLNKPNSLIRIQTKEDDARDRANDVTVMTKYMPLIPAGTKGCDATAA